MGRGTLKRMPARLEVHDMAGRLVTSGPVQPWRGSALWRCASVPSGAYLLTVLDSDGAPVSTATILKQ